MQASPGPEPGTHSRVWCPSQQAIWKDWHSTGLVMSDLVTSTSLLPVTVTVDFIVTCPSCFMFKMRLHFEHAETKWILNITDLDITPKKNITIFCSSLFSDTAGSCHLQQTLKELLSHWDDMVAPLGKCVLERAGMLGREKTRERGEKKGITRPGEWELLHGNTGTAGSTAHGGPAKEQRKRVQNNRETSVFWLQLLYWCHLLLHQRDWRWPTVTTWVEERCLEWRWAWKMGKKGILNVCGDFVSKHSTQ